jgi:3-oxoacyl-[acyl-carrier-protein] synthase II
MTTMLPNMASYQVSYMYGLKGPSSTIITACASGAQAIGEGFEAIRRGAADMMLAGGSEASHCLTGMAGFCAMRALSTRNDEPERASRPFDRDRDGFVVSEGCGMLLLEELGHALARGAPIHAELLGYGASCDAYHLSAPDPTGGGAARAMEEALDQAGVGPGEVGYVNAHATSTPLGDVAETQALKRALGEHAYRIPVSATKSMTGHMLGASGAVEAIVSVLTIRDGMVHPTINYETPDPECDLDYVPNAAREAEVDRVLSNSFAFGGVNVSLLLGRYEG